MNFSFSASTRKHRRQQRPPKRLMFRDQPRYRITVICLDETCCHRLEVHTCETLNDRIAHEIGAADSKDETRESWKRLLDEWFIQLQWVPPPDENVFDVVAVAPRFRRTEEQNYSWYGRIMYLLQDIPNILIAPWEQNKSLFEEIGCVQGDKDSVYHRNRPYLSWETDEEERKDYADVMPEHYARLLREAWKEQ
jgi:hypothetical protein